MLKICLHIRFNSEQVSHSSCPNVRLPWQPHLHLHFIGTMIMILAVTVVHYQSYDCDRCNNSDVNVVIDIAEEGVTDTSGEIWPGMFVQISAKFRRLIVKIISLFN